MLSPSEEKFGKYLRGLNQRVESGQLTADYPYLEDESTDKKTANKLFHGRDLLRELRERLNRQASAGHPSPTPSQAKAGNYRMGHVKIHGLDISIENAAGTSRSGVDKNGKPWSVTMKNHYGYIKGSIGADGDHVDVFVGPHPESDLVFIVDQNKSGTDKFDEHKCVLGCDSIDEAYKLYHDNYSTGWTGFRGIKQLTIDEFKTWLKSTNHDKPILKGFLLVAESLLKALAKRDVSGETRDADVK